MDTIWGINFADFHQLIALIADAEAEVMSPGCQLAKQDWRSKIGRAKLKLKLKSD